MDPADIIEEHSADVAVIGAGLAGLMAARVITAVGRSVIVLEARGRVGGKTYTRLAADGTPIDLGGQWIGPTQDHVEALALELGLKTFPTYDMGENIEIRQGQRHQYAGAIPTADPQVAMATVELLLELNLMAQQVPLATPWTANDAASWDAQTVQHWLESHVESGAVRILLTQVVRAVFSVEPRDLSLLHFLFYVHSAGSLNQLVGVTRGAQERRFYEGAQTLANRMADELGDRVILDAPVRMITQDDQGVRIDAGDTIVTARRAILALAPTLAGRIRYNPPLPARRDQLTQRMPMGTVIKVQCLYPTAFWRADGLSGQVLSDEDALGLTFDNSPPSGRPGILLGFMEGDAGRQWSDGDPAARRALVLASLAKYFGPAAATPTEYFEQVWAREEYSRGGYAGYMPPGVWTSYGEALHAPCGRLHWAGTETSPIWNGYMEGAIRSGERAAAEVLSAL